MGNRCSEQGAGSRGQGAGLSQGPGLGRQAVLLILVSVCAAWVAAQAPAPDRAKTEALAKRVNERVRALQQEADRLTGEARTLVGDLRRLEIERDLHVERASLADREVAAAQAELDAVTNRLAALDERRVASLPDLRARFVELYKHGRGSYVRMLAGVRDLRELGRATRAIASLAHLNQQRISEHRKTLDEMRRERAAIEKTTSERRAQQAEAQKARVAAERAVAARAALVAQIDHRRDLNAQLAGELQIAQQKLAAALSGLTAGQPVEPVSVPLTPFRGSLDWPVAGRLSGRFGQSGRMGGGIVRSGIEIEASEGTPVVAVHAGTVERAGPFQGYGTIVIVDHGANAHSLYGYLSGASVQAKARVEAGDELGWVGSAPAGAPTLYFEMRVDGRSVDPVQWLKKR